MSSWLLKKVADFGTRQRAARLIGHARNRALGASSSSARWLLFEYKGLELVIWSKTFKSKKLAGKARLKYPDRVRRKWFSSPIVDFPEYLKECVRVSPSKYCAYLAFLLVTEMHDIAGRHFGDRRIVSNSGRDPSLEAGMEYENWLKTFTFTATVLVST